MEFFIGNHYCRDDDDADYWGVWSWVYDMNHLTRSIIPTDRTQVYEDYFDINSDRDGDWGIRFDQSIRLKVKKVL